MGKSRTALIKGDFGMAATVVCTAGQFNLVGTYTVPAGLVVIPGYGDKTGQEDAQGRIYCKLQTTTPTEVPGIVRLSILDPQLNFLAKIAEFRTEALSASTDRTKQIPFEMQDYGASEDKKICFFFKPDATATITLADSTILIDATSIAA